MNALILFTEYDEKKANSALAIVKQIIERCYEFKFTLVRINNKHPEMPWQQLESDLPREYFVGGDNSCHEFTGWDKGWNDSKDQIKDAFDIVIIANDALLNSKPVRELESITNHLLRYVSKTKAVVGWLDTFSRVSPYPIDMVFGTMKVFGKSVRRWVCTTFIVFPAAIFESVIPLTRFEDLEKIYHQDFSDGVFLPTCGLNKNYQNFLFAHQSKKWIKRYILSAETFNLFKLKTRNILNEHLLGYRIKKTKAKLFHISILQLYQIKNNPSFMARVIKSLFSFPNIQYFLLYLLSLKLNASEIYRSVKKYYRTKMELSKWLFFKKI